MRLRVLQFTSSEGAGLYPWRCTDGFWGSFQGALWGLCGAIGATSQPRLLGATEAPKYRPKAGSGVLYRAVLPVTSDGGIWTHMGVSKIRGPHVGPK